MAEAAGVDPRRVNYVAFSGGGEAVAALIGGHVAAGISGYGEFAAHIASGRLRALAISSPSRLPGVEVPTIRESGLDVEMSNWRGLLAPAGIGDADRTALTALVRAAVQTDEWRQILLVARSGTISIWTATPSPRSWRTETDPLRAASSPGCAVRRNRSACSPAGASVPATVAARRGADPPAFCCCAPAGPGRRRACRARGEVLSIVTALAVFLLLVRPLGFVGASTALFVISVRAFRRLSEVDGRPEAGLRRADRGAAPSALLVDLAFRRGLDLPLPAGTLWSWMR